MPSQRTGLGSPQRSNNDEHPSAPAQGSQQDTATVQAPNQQQQNDANNDTMAAAEHDTRQRNVFNPSAMSDPPPFTDTGSKAGLPDVARHVDVRDRIVLITGATSGCGFETAVHLARMGCIIVMACRDVDRADQKRREIMQRANVSDLSRIRIVELELSDLDDVEQFPVRYDREMGDWKDRPIDILVLNAGIMAPLNRYVSKQGFEAQLAINVLGHFKLLAKLINRVKRSPHGRIVFVGSMLHLMSLGKIDFEDLNREKSYWKWVVYAETKLGFLLLMERLSRLFAGKQNVPLVVACHPGYAATKIHVHTIAGFANNLVAQSADKCAKSFVMAAVDPDAKPAGYCGPRFFLYGDPTWNAPMVPAVFDKDLQDRFWFEVERMTGENLDARIQTW